MDSNSFLLVIYNNLLYLLFTYFITYNTKQKYEQ